MVKNMFDIIDINIANKRFIGGLGRLKKDGTIKKINGQIFERRTTKKGEPVILIDNFFGTPRKNQTKRWQLVLVKNLISLNESKWSHVKKVA
ncbi:hypothetical protein LCGC14_1774350 [marine sediment metagenome]|uniref:Uncharacterized protein n=1 Tax=marine sediment metagenome TaxID=412755 RepID=A0A0F9JX12_9ZZZZ